MKKLRKKVKSLLATENLQNHFFFGFLVFNFYFWRNLASKKNFFKNSITPKILIEK
jgi:hypothetical protein